MTDKEFCKIDTEFYGEVIDDIKQIKLRSFDGEELKEYVEHCIKLNLLTIPVVIVPKGTLPLNKLKDGIDEYLDGQRNHIIERTLERMRTIEVVAYHCKRIAEDLTE
jgi:methyltransferase-like protein